MNMHTVLLHNTKELDDDFGAGSDHALPLACLLGVVDRLEGIIQNGSLDHVGGVGWVRKGEVREKNIIQEILKPM
jgi:hypothetical protein